jgi:DNA-binding MarR family transcriptional regulator
MSTDSGAAADRIHSAAIHLLRRVRAVDARMGLTPARASALSVLVFGGPCSLTELAEAEQVSVPTMSRLVAALEREALVRRVADVADGRSVRLHPTPKARRILRRGRERRTALLESLLEGATRHEIAVVAEAAEIVERALR